MRGHLRGCRRSVGRGACRPAIEPRKKLSSGCRRRLLGGRPCGRTRKRERSSDPARSETLACTDALCTETGRSLVWPVEVLGWSVSGRRGAVADDARTREVRLRHSSDEACEQSWATGCGADGAKGGGRGKHGRATHAPDTEPGKRAPGARPCTANSKGKKEGTVHRSSPSCDSRPTQGRLFLA